MPAKKSNWGLSIILAAAWSTAALAGNPISPRFNADPSPHAFAGKFYLYATNDQDNSG